MVGATGFEPATTWSQTRSATGLRYTPNVILLIASAKVSIFADITKEMSQYFMTIPKIHGPVWRIGEDFTEIAAMNIVLLMMALGEKK